MSHSKERDEILHCLTLSCLECELSLRPAYPHCMLVTHLSLSGHLSYQIGYEKDRPHLHNFYYSILLTLLFHYCC